MENHLIVIKTTRRSRIADVKELYARKAVRDVCYLHMDMNYFYSHKKIWFRDKVDLAGIGHRPAAAGPPDQAEHG